MKPRECKKMISNEPLKVVCGTIARSGNTLVFCLIIIIVDLRFINLQGL